MKREAQRLELRITDTAKKCPIGEVVGQQGLERERIPVLSCEGACIRGEIARLAANMVAREPGYGRGCHGELITVPRSKIARWIKSARRVVLIDGCFLRCHGRVLENLLDEDQLVQFDALGVHRKYVEFFDSDDVPEAERRATARQVADFVLRRLNGASEPARDDAGQLQKGGSPCQSI